MSDINKGIAERLKEKRNEKGFTQKTFSKALAINVATYNKIEAGLGVKVEILEKAAIILDCSLTWLLTGENLVTKEESKNENNQMIALDDQVLKKYLISAIEHHDKINQLLEQKPTIDKILEILQNTK